MAIVQDVLNKVSQDLRSQFSATDPATGKTLLIDYTDRIQKQMLRWSNWNFILSDPKYFLTHLGQTDYWIGPTIDRPAGTVETSLDLEDMDRIRKDSVVDMSNFRNLKWLREAPIGPALTYSDAQSRPGQPAAWRQDENDENIFSIFPAPINTNTYQPVPQTPVVDHTSGGALLDRVYFVVLTLVDSLGRESARSRTSQKQFIPASSTAIVRSPELIFPAAANGILYNRYNVYAVKSVNYASDPNDPGTASLQNVSPIAIGTDWPEPGSGLTTSGAQAPSTGTIEPLGGYIVKFRYYKDRITLVDENDELQIPNKYVDILVQGVNALGWKLLEKAEQYTESQQLFMDGYRQMVVDKNLFPEGVEFIRPDSNSYVNQQILGYLPPFF